MEKSQKAFEEFVEDTRKDLDKKLKLGHISQEEHRKAREHTDQMAPPDVQGRRSANIAGSGFTSPLSD